MIDRLANVLYWLGCGMAAILAVGGIAAAASRQDQAIPIIGLFGLSSAVIWLFGRACRYILSGR